MNPIVPWLIEKLEARWAPARLIAGPLPSEFGAELTPPAEFDAETALEPDVLPVPPVSEIPVSTVVEFVPAPVDDDDGGEDEETVPEFSVPPVFGGTIIVRPPSFAAPEIVLNPPVRIAPVQPVADFIGLTGPLTVISVLESGIETSGLLPDVTGPFLGLGSYSVTSLASLVVSAPSGGSVQLGSKLVTSGIVNAVPIGDLSAALHDALRVQPPAPDLALSAEGSTLPVGEEIPPAVPVVDEE